MSDLSPILGDVALDLIEICKRATACGLIRVNGLPVWQFGDTERMPMYIVGTDVQSVNHYCTNNGKLVVVTRDGDMFWGESRCAKWVYSLRQEFCRSLGIVESFVNVPASNGEEFLEHHLTQRLADPFCEPTRGWTKYF